MFGIQSQRHVHRLFQLWGGILTAKHPKHVRSKRFLRIRRHGLFALLDPSLCGKHGRQLCKQSLRLPQLCFAARIGCLTIEVCKCAGGGPHKIHDRGTAWNRTDELEHFALKRSRGSQSTAKVFECIGRGQFPMQNQISDLFERSFPSEIFNRISPVTEARPTGNRADCSFARHNAL